MTKLSPKFFFNLSTYSHSSLFSDINYVWEALSKIKDYFKVYKGSRINPDNFPGAYLINPEEIFLGQNSCIEPGAYLKGPCILGDNCSVRHGAYIRGNVITGNNCVIGHDTEMKNVILLDFSVAAHFAYVGDSILGNHVNLGAGTKCANLKLDHSNVTIRLEETKIATGLRKLGAIIGDKTQIGCNTVLNPGTLLGPEVLCYSSLNIGGLIPPNSVVKASTKPFKVISHSQNL